jgi:predicted transcriptional regulator of viral defense system
MSLVQKWYRYVSMPAPSKEPFSRERAIIRSRGGMLRMADALRLGINRKVFYAMRDAGVLEQLSRGLFRLHGLSPLANPDLVTVAVRIPEGVICLVSALAYHELTTQVPHEVDVAIERGKKNVPRIDYPPVRVFRFSGAAFRVGTETHRLDGVGIRIYSAEKTIADCFKFRNKLGMEVVLDALRFWRRRPRRNLDRLLQHAHHCRVERVLRPYLEALQ